MHDVQITPTGDEVPVLSSESFAKSTDDSSLKNGHEVQSKLKPKFLSPTEELATDQEVRNLVSRINFDSRMSVVPDHIALSRARPEQVFDIIEHINKRQRRELVTGFLEIGLKSKGSCAYVLSNLAPAVVPLSSSERVDLLEWLYDQPSTFQRTELMVGILRLSRNVRQLHSVLQQFGIAPIIEMRSRKLNEFVATEQFGMMLREVELPKRVSSRTPSAVVDSRIDELVEILEDQLFKISTNIKLSATKVSKHFCGIINNNISQLRYLQHETNEKLLATKFNSILKKLELEFHYGISLRTPRPKNDENSTFFTIPEIRELGKSIATLPRLLSYPYCKGVLKVKRFKERTTIAQWEDGWLEVCPETFTDRGHSREFSLTKPGGPALAHELGHCLQQGAKEHIEILSDLGRGFLGRIVGPTDPIFPLREFLSIAGWFVVDPKKVKWIDHNTAFTFNRERFNLAQEFRESGQRFLLIDSDSEGLVFCRRSKAEVSTRTYGSSTPFEHAADSLAFYLHNPLALIRDTPKIFALLDRHYHLYRSNVEVVSALNSRLAELYPRERHQVYLPVKKTNSLIGRVATEDVTAIQDKAQSGYELSRYRINTTVGMTIKDFLKSRFERFTHQEQDQVITLMSTALIAERGKRNGVPHAPIVPKDPRSKMALFSRMLSVGTLDPVQAQANAEKAIGFIMQRYNPGLLPLIEGYLKGDEIAIITQRGDREAHLPMVKELEEFLGFRIPTTYFLGDQALNIRLRKQGFVSEDQMRLQVIREFVDGFYLNIDGQQCQMQKYRKVIMYEDSPSSYNELKLYKKTNRWTHQFCPLHVAMIPTGFAWQSICDHLRNKQKELSSSPRSLRLCTLDGALVNVHAFVYVRDSDTSKIVAMFAPEVWEELKAQDRWKEEIHRLRPDIDIANLWIDREDFSGHNLLQKQVLVPDMFRLRSFQSYVPRGRIPEQ